MKITIHRSGGLAGAVGKPASLETAALGAEQQAAALSALDRLTQLVRDHHPVGADFIRYEILIEEAGRRRTLSFADDGSENAAQLVKAAQSIEGLAEGKR